MKITRKILRELGFHFENGELDRFIPPGGITAREFIHLPVDQLLARAGDRSIIEIRVNILIEARAMSPADVFPALVFAAEYVLPIFESAAPDDFRPRRALELAKHLMTGEKVDALVKRATRTDVFLAMAAYEDRKRVLRAGRASAWLLSDVPYDSIQALSDAAFVSARSAGDQAKFWESVYRILCERIQELE